MNRTRPPSAWTRRALPLHALLAVTAALVGWAPGALAQGSATPPLPTGTFGNWSLSATQDAGLQISNQRRPEAVRLKLTATSNGWFLLETTAGQFISWTAGTFSNDTFTFDAAKPDAGAPALQTGTYSFGTWTITVAADELRIDHDANPHTVVLPRGSVGGIEIRGLRSRGDIRVAPDDNLSSGPSYGPGGGP
mgnify:CR=1 FL=1